MQLPLEDFFLCFGIFGPENSLVVSRGKQLFGGFEGGKLQVVCS